MFFPKQRLRYGVLTRLLILVSRAYPPAGSVPHRFLLLFTALGEQKMRLACTRHSAVHVFVVKRYGFEHSNAPIPPVAQIRPGTPNGPQMDPK